MAYSKRKLTAKAEGTIVRMTCYTGDFQGTLTPSSKIDRIAFFTYNRKSETSPVDQLIF